MPLEKRYAAQLASYRSGVLQSNAGCASVSKMGSPGAVGAADVAHIEKVRRFSTAMEIAGRTLIHVSLDPVTFAAGVSGQTINFPSVSFSGNTPGGDAVSVVATTGRADVAASGEITGTLNGTYQTTSGSCTAADHQLQMRRCVVTCSGNICACV